MPRMRLTGKIVSSATCPVGKRKVDFFDEGARGLMLEVRATGGRTYYLRYVDRRGKQHQLRIADAADISLEQARKEADRLRGRIALGEDPAAKKAVLRQIPTFAAFVHERYLPYAKGYKRSWSTDLSLLKNHLLPAFGDKHLDQIDKHEIITFHHAFTAKGYAPATANRPLILLRTIFNRAIEWEIPGVTKNPTKGIPLLVENNKIERFLTAEEAKRLYAALLESPNPLLRYIVMLALLTGARKNEVLKAKWADFDLDRRIWKIPHSKSGKARHVPLSDGALTVLAEVPRIPGNVHVFPNRATGKPFVTVFYAWDSARKAAGLPDFRMHDLRHSFASLLVNAGRTLYEVQTLLGHAHSKTTQRYAHLSSDSLLDAANAAARAIDLDTIAEPVLALPALTVQTPEAAA
jgi:integrase